MYELIYVSKIFLPLKFLLYLFICVCMHAYICVHAYMCVPWHLDRRQRTIHRSCFSPYTTRVPGNQIQFLRISYRHRTPWPKFYLYKYYLLKLTQNSKNSLRKLVALLWNSTVSQAKSWLAKSAPVPPGLGSGERRLQQRPKTDSSPPLRNTSKGMIPQ